MVRLMPSTGMKWRATSSERPRHGKRGSSRISTKGTENPGAAPRAAGVCRTSSRNVSKPRSAPSGASAESRIPVPVTSSAYRSSSPSCCVARWSFCSTTTRSVARSEGDAVCGSSGKPVCRASCSTVRSAAAFTRASAAPAPEREIVKLVSMATAPPPALTLAGHGMSGGRAGCAAARHAAASIPRSALGLVRTTNIPYGNQTASPRM